MIHILFTRQVKLNVEVKPVVVGLLKPARVCSDDVGWFSRFPPNANPILFHDNIPHKLGKGIGYSCIVSYACALADLLIGYVIARFSPSSCFADDEAKNFPRTA